jgi:hypothetical protein
MGVTVTDPGPAGHRTFLVTLHPTRANWPAAMTDDEQRALSEHAAGLSALADRGLCALAGPCLDAQLGVAVYDGLTLEQTTAQLAGDAMVTAGYFDAQVRAMRLSFERVSPSPSASAGGGTTGDG